MFECDSACEYKGIEKNDIFPFLALPLCFFKKGVTVLSDSLYSSSSIFVSLLYMYSRLQDFITGATGKSFTLIILALIWLSSIFI